jgi:hypothetical protein
VATRWLRVRRCWPFGGFVGTSSFVHTVCIGVVGRRATTEDLPHGLLREPGAERASERRAQPERARLPMVAVHAKPWARPRGAPRARSPAAYDSTAFDPGRASTRVHGVGGPPSPQQQQRAPQPVGGAYGPSLVPIERERGAQEDLDHSVDERREAGERGACGDATVRRGDGAAVRRRRDVSGQSASKVRFHFVGSSQPGCFLRSIRKGPRQR